MPIKREMAPHAGCVKNELMNSSVGRFEDTLIKNDVSLFWALVASEPLFLSWQEAIMDHGCNKPKKSFAS